MNLINVKNMSNEYLDLVRYYFEGISNGEDLYKLMSFLQKEGYDISRYSIYYDHDHTEDLVIDDCDNIETLVKLVNECGLSNISSIDFYGNCNGTFIPSEEIVNISVPKKKYTR